MSALAVVSEKQAIAGVSPASVRETTVMTVWPSISALAIGRLLGRLFSIRLGFYIFRLGNFIALALRTQRSLCQHVETSGSNTIFAVSRARRRQQACARSRLVRRGGLCEIS